MKTKNLLKSTFIAAFIAAMLQMVSCNEEAKKEAMAAAEAEAAKKAAEAKEAELREFIASGGGFLADSRDGKTYRTIKMGEQTWMAENLKYEANGSECYNNEPENCEERGRLYNWKTAKKSCPSDWHLPSEEEWETLVNFAGGHSTASEKLKASGWDYNDCTNGNCANDDGDYHVTSFGGITTISRSSDGNIWWTASGRNDSQAYYRGSGRQFYWDPADKSAMFSIRCLQDQDKKQLKAAMAKLTPMAELEQEAEKWIKNDRPYERQGKHFSFQSVDPSPCTECGVYKVEWTATSKADIDDCPANSVWKMVLILDEGSRFKSNKVPPECELITPKTITDYSEEYEQEYD
jgi:uncharacterized protein (TIGR02145 family)